VIRYFAEELSRIGSELHTTGGENKVLFSDSENEEVTLRRQVSELSR
jgi:hypothetical protein|tara:strand:- start:323 stop:463 length:141 start_codon:yes stop_codon:yes gene_type:complete